MSSFKNIIVNLALLFKKWSVFRLSFLKYFCACCPIPVRLGNAGSSVYFEIGGRRRRRRRARRWTRPQLPSRSTSAYTSNSPTPPTSCSPSPCPPSASPSPPPARPLPAASRPASPPPTTPPSRAWTSPWPSATPASRPTRRRRTRGRSRRTASARRKRFFYNLMRFHFAKSTCL